ncbi:MAG: PVC-type heme-binding CxxCH protein, partial [Planctomycetota bacterium]|nr:PVC-type heme-binding CxxCH protein [Planctomycetota bacterium]
MRLVLPPIQTAFLSAVALAFLSSALASGEDLLKEFQLHPDCEIELVASEPNVIDPVAIRFDERGRLWVVEMRDYPTLNAQFPSSKIKILEDRNRDGFFEFATTFADRLLFPTGIQPWKEGVIVTLAGKIVYLGDQDDDGVCDEEKILFEGFAEKNTQLRANHPTLGPDGKIYVANGLRNGEIRGPTLTQPLSINGMDFRFDPNSLECEAVTGYGQFGLTFDAGGNRYTCTNRNPLKRIVIENEYLRSTKEFQVSQSVIDVAAAGSESRLYPIGETWTTSNLHANQFTAACGVHIYNGISLPKEFKGNAFTCDPTANVVHREIISFESDKVVGHSRPGRSKIEFLASPNSEFRPVNLAGGPDG